MCNTEATQAQPTRHTSMFSEVVMVALFLNNFKMLNTLYNSKGDLTAHVEVFCLWKEFERVSELARCQAFPLMLSRLTQSWHSKLPSESIISFEQ